MQILRTLFPVFLVCVLAVTVLAMAAGASEVVTSDTEETSEASSEPEQVSVEDPWEIVNVEVTETVRAVTPNDANGLKKIMLQLIGDYEMVTKEYTYTSNNGYQTKQVTTESDYSWWFSCGVFALVLYSMFRLLGGVLIGRK